MEIFISESAQTTKSLRGATAYEAKGRVKVEDDDHESNIKKGEKFYLKKLGKKHYVIDLEKEGGKTVYYQFIVDKATYDKLAKKHKNTDDAPGMKEKREQSAGRKKAQDKKASGKPAEGKAKGSKANSKDLKSADTSKAIKAAFKSAGLDVKVSKNSKTDGVSIGFTGKPTAKAVEQAFGELAKNVTGTIYAKEISRMVGGRGKGAASIPTAKKEFIISSKRTPGNTKGLAFKITKAGATLEGPKK